MAELIDPTGYLKVRRLDRIIDAIDIDHLKIVEVGREDCQARTEVGSGHCCQPEKLVMFAPEGLGLLIVRRPGCLQGEGGVPTGRSESAKPPATGRSVFPPSVGGPRRFR